MASMKRKKKKNLHTLLSIYLYGVGIPLQLTWEQIYLVPNYRHTRVLCTVGLFARISKPENTLKTA